MKFVFKNLGPIDKAELELGDLTIIAGRNNTGKTYVAYTLYGFLQELYQGGSYLRILVKSHVPNMENLAEIVAKEGQVEWPVDIKSLNLERDLITQEFAQDFSERIIARVFNSSEKDFEDTSVKVSIENEFPEYAETRVLHSSQMNKFTINYGNGKICISRSKIDREPFSTTDILFYLTDLYVSFLFPEIPQPFILSAERFGISLFYKELDFSKGRLVETLQRVGKDSGLLEFIQVNKMASRYALPIRDNIDYTRSLPDLQWERSELYDSKLFEDIKNMMGGYYKSSGDDIRFRSKARKARRFDIPLHIASSSARGLSDLYFFLRHVAEEGQLLIIDEPESHLDTANQIQFARLLARAVRAGLKVLITTHSDYIVKEINNLLMLSTDFKDKSKVLKKLKYSEHDFLEPDSVRAYVAENNSLTRCTIERYGIDMPVFDTTIHEINKVSNELGFRLKHEGEK